MHKLLSTQEVAHRLSRDVSTVSRWVAAGRLNPVYRFPGKRGACLFDPAEVDALVGTYDAAQPETVTT